MLVEFITQNRAELIARTRTKVAKRLAPRPTKDELASGVPLFLDQIVEKLRNPPSIPPGMMERSAAKHGAALLARGYTVGQVVHDYGDICQVVTEVAEEAGEQIPTDEFHTLNLALDNAIAEAVTAYTRIRDESVVGGETERLGVFAHELRNKIAAASLGFQAIRSGRAPANGSVSAVILRAHAGMTSLVNRALVEVRLESGGAQKQRTHLGQLIDEAEVEGTMEAGAYGISLSVTPADSETFVFVDPQILAGVIANILQNAFKFTHAGGHVSLKTSVTGARVLIEVEDQCGGLPAGKAEELFEAFERRGTDRSGLGLGLFISRKGIEASGGELRVTDVAGTGCVFTIDLPLMPLAS